MKLLKFILQVIVSFLFGFGFWYFIGILFSSEFNPLLWPIYGKILYMIFSWGTARTVQEIIQHY